MKTITRKDLTGSTSSMEEANEIAKEIAIKTYEALMDTEVGLVPIHMAAVMMAEATGAMLEDIAGGMKEGEA